jgi:hypothetical protein
MEATMDSEATKEKKTNLEHERRAAEYVAKRRREDLLETCRSAVECLEPFAADARRKLEHAAELEGARLVELPIQVLSASTWGAANASSELGSASRIAAEYMNALGVLEALKGDAR